MPIGERIKVLRTKLRLSQSELGDRVDTDSTIISRWETNRVRPSQKYIIKLANALGTSTDYLLGETDDPAAQFDTMLHIQPSTNVHADTSHIDTPAEERSVIEKNRGKLMYTFRDGEKLELPDTDRGYALFEKILMQKAVMA